MYLYFQECLAERESIYRILSQTTPENICKDFGSHSLDPSSRYPTLNTRLVLPFQVGRCAARHCAPLLSTAGDSMLGHGQPGPPPAAERATGLGASQAQAEGEPRQPRHSADLAAETGDAPHNAMSKKIA